MARRASVRVGVLGQRRLHVDALHSVIADVPYFAPQVMTHRWPEIDVAVLEVSMSGLPGLIAEISSTTPTIVWGGYLHSTQARELANHGAAGYLSVISLPAHLHAAIEMAAGGGRYFPDLGAPDQIRLTPAEDRVMRAYLIDLSTQRRSDVALALGLSDRTVKAHIANVRSRLPVRAPSRATLLRVLRAHGWS
jgi:DNA-binding NarL/FixJ family response regulator